MKKLMLVLSMVVVLLIVGWSSVDYSEISNFRGYWIGQWNSSSYPAGDGEVTATIMQDGSNLTVTATITETNCYDIIIDMTGQVQGDRAQLNGSYYCVSGRMWMTYEIDVTLSGNLLSGDYTLYIAGAMYDSGTLTLTKHGEGPPDDEGGCFYSVVVRS